MYSTRADRLHDRTPVSRSLFGWWTLALQYPVRLAYPITATRPSKRSGGVVAHPVTGLISSVSDDSGPKPLSTDLPECQERRPNSIHNNSAREIPQPVWNEARSTITVLYSRNMLSSLEGGRHRN